MKNQLHDILTSFIHELSNTTIVTEYAGLSRPTDCLKQLS